jgi:Methionine synthase I (cobalamin-dependent), methyltransferase domain
VLGPTNRTASIFPDKIEPGFGNVDLDRTGTAYAEATRAVIEGGSDIIVLETQADTAAAKAVLLQVWQVFDQDGVQVSIIMSGTITDQSGRIVTRHTIEAFYNSITTSTR